MSPYFAHPSLRPPPPPPLGNGASAAAMNSITPPLTPSSLADDITVSDNNGTNQAFSVPQSSSQQSPLPSDEHSPLSEQPSTAAFPSSLYDLYGVVHHVGAMGGGHYVTTVRDRNTPATTAATIASTAIATSFTNTAASSSTSSSLSSSSSGRAAETDKVSDDAATTTTTSHRLSGTTTATVPPPPVASAAAAPGGQWWCFNDDVVTLVGDPSEVCSASAYVLFYMRRDMWGKGKQATNRHANNLCSNLSIP